MNLAVEAPQWLALILAALLIAAAVEDAVRLRISNIICGLILLAALVAAGLAGPEWSLWQNLAVFVAFLVVGTPLFAAGKFGGGDIKLLATTALWFDLSGALQMLIAVLLSGGVLALLILFGRALGWSDGVRQKVRLLRPNSGIPYGMAIAAGALITVAMQRG